MHSLIDTLRCRKSFAQQMLVCMLLVLLVSIAPAFAADDPYLEMLDQEATKVEGPSSDTGDNGNAISGTGGNPQPMALPSRQRFEQLLRQQNVGTYSFYRKLPERSREEIFLDYSKGASMEALREKIVNRYLHP